MHYTSTNPAPPIKQNKTKQNEWAISILAPGRFFALSIFFDDNSLLVPVRSALTAPARDIIGGGSPVKIL